MDNTSRSYRRIATSLLVFGLVFSGLSASVRAESEGGDDGAAEQQGDKNKEDDTPENATFHTVEKGETVGTIALEYGSSVRNILDWNDLELGEAEAGMRIVVEADEEPDKQEESSKPMPVIHVVKKGDILGEIAERYRVSTDQIERWNPGLNPRRLQLGERIKLYVPGRDGESVSYGRASNGKLYNGVPLKSWHGIDTRNLAEAYGTKRVIEMLYAAAADVQARWPGTPDLVVGDLSYKRGGHMSPHKSHQSGRDADISFYYRGNVQLPRFFPMTESSFDARKNWHFYKTLIDTGEVEYIFVSYYLQEMLYEYARSIGYTKEQLKPILQYPRSKHQPKGIIRHSAGHDDHIHIRFTCGPKDRHCR
jgi:LysM repeat protein